MIKMYLKIQDIFTSPNEFLPDMSGGQTEFREDCSLIYCLHLPNKYIVKTGIVNCEQHILTAQHSKDCLLEY